MESGNDSINCFQFLLIFLITFSHKVYLLEILLALSEVYKARLKKWLFNTFQELSTSLNYIPLLWFIGPVLINRVKNSTYIIRVWMFPTTSNRISNWKCLNQWRHLLCHMEVKSQGRLIQQLKHAIKVSDCFQLSTSPLLACLSGFLLILEKSCPCFCYCVLTQLRPKAGDTNSPSISWIGE